MSAVPTASETAISSSSATASAKPPSKARWGLLKRALVSSNPPSSISTDSSGSSISVRRHEGFRLFHHEILNQEQIIALQPPAFNHTDLSRYQYQRFSLLAPLPSASCTSSTSSAPSSTCSISMPPCCFRVRRPDSVKLSELAPDQKVDNTGNICIWNSEEILAHVVLSHMVRQIREGATEHAPRPVFDPKCIGDSAAIPADPPIDYPDMPLLHTSSRPLRILELGAGMSGLCAIALASAASKATRNSKGNLASAATSPDSATTSAADSSPCIDSILITDGNAGCMEEVKFQIAWNAALKNLAPNMTVDCQTLVWDRHTDYSNLGKFDLILAADCLFFEKYHLDLCHVLRSLLVPHTGRACLLAPSRGGSLQRFMQKIVPSKDDSHTSTNLKLQADELQFTKGLCVTQLSHRYDEEIWRQHQGFLLEEQNRRAANSASSFTPIYSIDLHMPLLLTLAFEP